MAREPSGRAVLYLVFFVRRGGVGYAENPVIETTMFPIFEHKISGENARMRTKAGRSVFTPCAGGGSLLKTLPAAVKPAGTNRFLFSDFDQFRDNPHLEEVYLKPDKIEFIPELS